MPHQAKTTARLRNADIGNDSHLCREAGTSGNRRPATLLASLNDETTATAYGKSGL
jgi:hypothetical protein